MSNVWGATTNMSNSLQWSTKQDIKMYFIIENTKSGYYFTYLGTFKTYSRSLVKDIGSLICVTPSKEQALKICNAMNLEYEPV